VEDIYRRLRTGWTHADPSFADLIDQKFLTTRAVAPRPVCRSLSPPARPRCATWSMPADPARCRSPGRFGVGARGRYWFRSWPGDHKSAGSRGVSGWVQAMHDGKTLAAVSWTTAREPRYGVAQVRAAYPRDRRRRRLRAASARRSPGRQLAVQFRAAAEGRRNGTALLPYGPHDPVYQWRGRVGRAPWPLAAHRAVRHAGERARREAIYEHGGGAWCSRAPLRRRHRNEVQLEAGRAIPMAFFAWDAPAGHGSRMAVSTVFLALDGHAPGVFISPCWRCS